MSRKIWVTSDWHLGHKKIIKYCSRPFDSVEAMDKAILDNFRAVVGKDDLVYFLGDFCFYKNPEHYLVDLPGEFIWVIGNHDRQTFFKHRPQTVSIEYGGMRIRLGHDPLYASMEHPLNLCGHIHERWQVRLKTRLDVKTTIVNVGVDVWDFQPVLLDTVLTLVARGAI